MIKFTHGNAQYETLKLALEISNYDTVASSVLAAIDSDPNTPDSTKHAIRAMAFKMATFNGGQPEAGGILHTIATAPWSAIGIADDAVTPLAPENRAAIIGVVMAVSKQIIAAEGQRFANLAATDTSLPEGWNTTG